MSLRALIGSQRRAQTSTQIANGILQRKCDKCRKKKRALQRSAFGPAPEIAPPVVHEVLSSPGQQLDLETRAFFEPRFGHDFSRVRVHADARAAESAWAVNALAYTVGQDVVFGFGQYAPKSSAGGRLLAHELMHVVQQDTLRMNISKGPETTELTRLSGQGEEPIAVKAPLSNLSSRHTSQLVRLDRYGPERSTTLNEQLSTERFYNSSNFSDRFDGIVNPRQRIITLSMRLSFELEGSGWLDPSRQAATPQSEQANRAFLDRFQREFKEIVERTWSYQYNLKPACPLDWNHSYRAKVDIVPVSSNPHAAIHVFRDTPGGRSNAGEGLSALQESDNQIQESRWTFRGKEKQYFQVPSAHEFGHLMGVDHIHCKGNDANCYGVTPEESLDIMGRGSVVSSRDYEPFLRIARRYGQDVTPAGIAGCNIWVTSGTD